jgi:FMN phosphatase YigB (HAD superfamily)
MTTLLVLDFDGTMTDAEREGAPFRGAYLDDIATLAALPRDEVEALAARFEREVADNAHAEGWLFGGHIVAPATVDPYLRIMPVARRILDHAGAFTVPAERDRLLDGVLYKHNYGRTAIAFREGAGDVLRGLAGTHTYVVTNSHTDAVQHKIEVLGGESGDLDWLVRRVHGRAKKYVLDGAWSAVAESMRLPGLERPVLLRRRLYHDALEALRLRAGVGWEDVVVVGDIFELDLALPLAMGARVGLLVNDFTPPWERAFLAEHPRGALLQDVSEIPGFAGLGPAAAPGG